MRIFLSSIDPRLMHSESSVSPSAQPCCHYCMSARIKQLRSNLTKKDGEEQGYSARNEESKDLKWQRTGSKSYKCPPLKRHPLDRHFAPSQIVPLQLQFSPKWWMKLLRNLGPFHSKISEQLCKCSKAFVWPFSVTPWVKHCLIKNSHITILQIQ